MRLSSRLAIVVAAVSMVAVSATYSQTHNFLVEDLLSLEYLGPTTVGWMRMPAAAFSHDGRWLAFVVQRPRTTAERYGLAGLDGATRADIWILPTTGGRPVNVTTGARDARGYWCPIWSPDGRRLAMLSTQGDFVQIYVWDREKNTVRRMSRRGTDAGQTEITSPDGEVGPMVWQDGEHLIAGLLATGEAGTVLDRDRGLERFALAQWERVKSGRQTTSSEIGSPFEVISRKESIAIIDVSRVTVQEIGAVPSVGRRWIRIAPGWEQGAVLTQISPDAMHSGHPPVPGYQTQVGVYSLSNPGITWSGIKSITTLLGWKPGLGFIVSERDKQLYSLSVPSASLGPLPDSAVDAARDGGKPDFPAGPVNGGEVLTTWRDRVAAKSEDQNGVHLWLCATRESCREAFTLNLQTASIRPARRITIDYTNVTSETLKAVLLQPPGYQPGRPYPAVVWVYGGSVFRRISDVRATITDPTWDNPELLAAHGYVVIFPSIPLKPYGTASDPLTDIAAGVMPAVEKAVEMGIADRSRLGIIGHSYGGYTTLSLLSQTKLFRAAVSLAGGADLLSFYGTFDPHNRYAAGISRGLLNPGLLEISQFRMGLPPWENIDRYIRNSPITYLDKIETPLMLVAGDLDSAMAQAEELYTGLRRLDKRVSLVRYFGEDHILDSPANIRDLWSRMFRWFDQNLLGQTDAAKRQ